MHHHHPQAPERGRGLRDRSGPGRRGGQARADAHIARHPHEITRLPCASLDGAASLQAFLKPTRRYRIHMLRRISLIAAAMAILALSALPASAATVQSGTHKLSFPGLHGVKAWGTYVKTSRGIRVNVCAEDTARNVFAAGAVVVASNASKQFHTNVGAVAFGYHQEICRSLTLRYTAHLQIYTFTGTKKGMIGSRSKTKNVY